MAKTEQPETKTKLQRADLIEKLNSVLLETSNDPSEEIIALGEALMKIGEALKGVSRADAIQVLKATAVLHGITIK